MYPYEGGGVIFSSLIKMLVRSLSTLVFNKSYFGYSSFICYFYGNFYTSFRVFSYFVIFIMFIVQT